MKKIVHISDLHFGREDKEVAATLAAAIKEYGPDVVVVSGDLTQRARIKQFEAAAHYLKKLPFPKVVVPGNHDVPLYDVTRRFIAPFTRYVHYINADFYPSFIDDPICVIGINTAYSFTWKSGRVTALQLRSLQEKLESAGFAIRILVIHHPFHEVFVKSHHHNILEELKIDLILSGHLHQASANVLNGHVSSLNLKTLLVQAGTAMSTRLRGESNSYNEIEVADDRNLTIIIKEYEQHQFKERKRCSFTKEGDQWMMIS